MPQTTENKWTEATEELLKGKKVTGARMMTRKEAEELGWSKRPVVLIFEGNIELFPSRDDEGNDAGSWFGNDPGGAITIPSVR